MRFLYYVVHNMVDLYKQINMLVKSSILITCKVLTKKYKTIYINQMANKVHNIEYRHF